MLDNFGRRDANIVYCKIDQRLRNKRDLRLCSPAIITQRPWRGMGKGDGLLASLGRKASMIVKRPKDVENLTSHRMVACITSLSFYFAVSYLWWIDTDSFPPSLCPVID